MILEDQTDAAAVASEQAGLDKRIAAQDAPTILRLCYYIPRGGSRRTWHIDISK
jgi:hypothetical protein